jgi:hypothetical protein
MKVVLSQINFIKGPVSTVSVTYTAELPVREATVVFLAGCWPMNVCGGVPASVSACCPAVTRRCSSGAGF